MFGVAVALLAPGAAAITASFVRLLCLEPQTVGNYFRVAEVQVSLAPSGANLCVGGVAGGNGNY